MMGAIGAILSKELRVEFRNKQTIVSYLLMAILIMAAFRFAFSTFDKELTELAAPMLWITIFFAGLFSMTPSYKREVDGRTKEGLLLAPVPHTAVFFGKLFASLMVVFGLSLVTLVLFFVFFPYDAPDMVALGTVMVLGILGFVILGNILSAISAFMEQAGVMLMILSIPLLLFTVVLSAISGTSEIFGGAGLADIDTELRFLAVFDLVFFAIGYLLIDYILEA
jgi:heme exporter protein B